MKPRSCAAVWCLAIVFVIAPLSLFAHDPSKPDEPYHQTDLTELHGIVEAVRQNASPDQLSQIDGLVAKAGPELQNLSKRANTAHRQKILLLLQDAVDNHALAAAQSAELKAAAELSKKTDDALVGLAKIMTTDQRSHFRDHVSQHHD